MEGWISLHRKLIESEIWEKPPLYIKVWVYLLLSAQHTQYKGLQPGQLVTSIPEIIEACKWRVGARIERPSRDQIYQIIEWLRKRSDGGNESNAGATMITTTKATQKMLITISNYAVYQRIGVNESNDESNDESPPNPQRKQRQPDNINNNDNNDNNDNNISSSRKRKTRVYETDDRYYKMALYFHGKVMEHAAANKVEHLVRDADMQKWADEFRKIIEISKRDPKELQAIIDWCTSHHFWSSNILSPKKLREKYQELGIKMATERKGAQGSGNRQDRNKEYLKKRMGEINREQQGTFTSPISDSHSLPDSSSF